MACASGLCIAKVSLEVHGKCRLLRLARKRVRSHLCAPAGKIMSMQATTEARFAGIDRLYGRGSAARLARAHVAVVGLGGVGSWAAEALARSGVGRLTLIDADEVCVSNTNRQSHALAGAFGRAKVDVVAERVRAINPELQVQTIARFVTIANLEEMLARDYDAVIDACDAIKVKVAMIAFCRRRKLPIVVSGSAGGRRDPTLITARDLSKTEHDVLLGIVRGKLRDDYGWTRNPKRYFGVQAVFSRENVNYPQSDGSVCKARAPDADRALKLDCAGGLGAAMHVTATFGMVAAARVIERLLSIAEKCGKD
jgi:tRNA A37 threonylcarbamoyladenosine dehydratase